MKKRPLQNYVLLFDVFYSCTLWCLTCFCKFYNLNKPAEIFWCRGVIFVDTVMYFGDNVWRHLVSVWLSAVLPHFNAVCWYNETFYLRGLLWVSLHKQDIIEFTACIWAHVDSHIWLLILPGPKTEPFKGLRCQLVALCHPVLTYIFNFSHSGTLALSPDAIWRHYA